MSKRGELAQEIQELMFEWRNKFGTSVTEDFLETIRDVEDFFVDASQVS